MNIIDDRSKGVKFSSLKQGDTFYDKENDIYGIVVSNLLYKGVACDVHVSAIDLTDGNSYCFEDQIVEKIELEARVI